MANDKKIDNLFFLGWVTSIIAMFGSLYFSEIKQFIPCDLCWYQRILMYPLTILLGVSYVRKDWNISLYAMIMAAVGGSISLFHYSLQKIPFMGEHADFCGQASCVGEYINWLGFITIPFLALTAFIIIFVTNFIVWKNYRK